LHQRLLRPPYPHLQLLLLLLLHRRQPVLYWGAGFSGLVSV
jgi:hypothetical protein